MFHYYRYYCRCRRCNYHYRCCCVVFGDPIRPGGTAAAADVQNGWRSSAAPYVTVVDCVTMLIIITIITSYITVRVCDALCYFGRRASVMPATQKPVLLNLANENVCRSENQ